MWFFKKISVSILSPKRTPQTPPKVIAFYVFLAGVIGTNKNVLIK
jgi:hypothetical protein